MAAAVILVDAVPRRAADAAAVTVRLAGGGGSVPYHYGGEHYRAGIDGLPREIASLDFDGEQLGGGGVGQALELRWAPASAAALAELANLFWGDAPITVRIGGEGAALPPVAAQGLVLDSAADAGVLRIALADGTADLKRPVLTDRFAGTGGVEGPADWEGRIKTRAWGRCTNVPGQIILPASNIACFGDPRRAWQSFDQVRVRGVAIETLTVLAWQGSVEATFAALVAIAVPAGTAVACPSIACVKWWTSPDGDLHADIRGEIAGGYVETAPAIAARIIAARSTLVVNAAELADAAAARPGPFGWRISVDGATAAAELSELLGGVSLSWLVADGQVGFRRWEWGASRRTARSQGVTRKQVYKPVGTRKLGFRRNWAPMARGDIAAIVFAREVVYDDGSSIVEAIAEATQAAIQASSDGWLDPSEKRQARIDYDQRTAQRDALQAQYVALGSPGTITAARDAAFARTQDLYGYLQGLAPSWLDYAVSSRVTDPAGYQAAWKASSDALEAFGAAITGRKGDKGDPGQSAYAIVNSNEAHTVAADAAGNVTDYGNASLTVTMFCGSQDVTAAFALESVDNPQALAGPANYPTYGINGGFDANEATASVTYTFIGKAGTAHAGVRLSTVFSLSKSKAGVAGSGGAAAPLVRVAATPQAIRYRQDNTIDSGNIVFEATIGGSAVGPVAWSSALGHGLYNTAGVTVEGNRLTISPSRMADVLAYNLSQGNGAKETIIASASGATDRVTVTKIQDGAKGENAPAISITPAASQILVGSDGNYLGGQQVRLDVVRVALPGTTRFLRSDGYDNTAAGYVAVDPTNYGSDGPDNLTIKGAAALMDAISPSTGKYSFTVYVAGADPRATATVNRVKDGLNAISIEVTGAQSVGIACTANGTPKPGSFAPASGKVRLRDGTNIITSGVAFALAAAENATPHIDAATGDYYFDGLSASLGTGIFRATYAGKSKEITVNLSKVRDGASGNFQRTNIAPFSLGTNTFLMVGSVELAVPPGATIKGAGALDYDVIQTNRSFSAEAKLTWQNVTDNGPETDFAGSTSIGSQAFLSSSGNAEGETNQVPGSVGTVGEVPGPAGSKIIVVRLYARKYGGSATSARFSGVVDISV